MQDALAISRQVAWEMEGVRRSVERYREAAATADPMTLPPGRKLLRVVCKPLIGAIAARQEEARGMLRTTGGRQAAWTWPIQLVDAEKLSVITLNAAVGAHRGVDGREANNFGLTAQAGHLASAVRDQVDYDTWTAEQEAANALAKKRKDDTHTNLLSALKKTYPNLDRVYWHRWRNKIAAARTEPWSATTRVSLGTCLFDCLVKSAPQYFKIDERPCKGGVQYFLNTTEECREFLLDVTARAEVSRPALLPMIIPPNPWRYECGSPNTKVFHA